GFANVAESCLTEVNCSTDTSAFLRDANNNAITGPQWLNQRFAQLPDRYAALADALMSLPHQRQANPGLGIEAMHVFFGEYPDATTSDDGTTICQSNELELPPETPQWAKDALQGYLDGLSNGLNGAGLITQTEWGWVRTAIVQRLSAAVTTAIGAANGKY